MKEIKEVLELRNAITGLKDKKASCPPYNRGKCSARDLDEYMNPEGYQ